MTHSSLLVLFGFSAISLLSGCASVRTDTPAAWNRYQEFDQALQQEGLDLHFEPFFSRHAYADIRDTPPTEVPAVKEMLAYPLYFNETFSHSEKVAGERRCLVVNGALVQGEIASLALEFIVEDELKINDANLLLVDSMKELPVALKCPDETRVSLGTF